MMGSNTGWCTRVFDPLLSAFVYNDYGARLALDNGKITFVANTEAFRDGLRYIGKLVAEGLIDPVSLTQTEAQAQIIGGNPENITLGVFPAATFESFLGDDRQDPLKRYKQYVALSPLKGPEGVQNTLTEEGGVTAGQFLITDKCKSPEVLFRWADGAYKAEVTLQSQAGPENTGWKKPDEGVLGIDGKPAFYTGIPWVEDTVQNYHMENIMLSNRTMDFRHGKAVDMSDPDALLLGEARRYNDTKNYYESYRSDQAPPPMMLTPEEADERSTIQAALEAYILESVVSFIAGNKDIEKDWDAYVKEFESMKLPRYLELLQTAYDRQYGNA